MGDQAKIAEHNRPEEVEKVGPRSHCLNELNCLAMDRV
jgi:hypothetical protein